MISKKISDVALRFVENLKQQRWIIGIVLLWWLGKRNNIDRYSDLDFAVFYNDKKTSLPIFEFHVIDKKDVFEFNVHQQHYDFELNNYRNNEKKNAYQNGIISYDPSGKIKELIAKKCMMDYKETKVALINFFAQYQRRVRIHSRRCIRRKDNYSAHLLLNNGIEIVFEILFLIHGKFIPHHKRRFSNLKDIPDIPKSTINNLQKAMLINSFSQKELEKRISYLDKVFYWCEKKINNSYGKLDYNEFSFRNAMHKQKDSSTKIDKIENMITEKWIFSLHEKKIIRWYLNYYFIDSIKKLKKLIAMVILPFDVDQRLKNRILTVIR